MKTKNAIINDLPDLPDFGNELETPDVFDLLSGNDPVRDKDADQHYANELCRIIRTEFDEAPFVRLETMFILYNLLQVIDPIKGKAWIKAIREAIMQMDQDAPSLAGNG